MGNMSGNKPNQPMMPGGAIAPGLLPGVKPNDLTGVTCKKCGGQRFIPTCTLRHAGRFQTAIGQPMLIEFKDRFACSQCGALNEFTIPGVTDKEEKKETEDAGPSIQ